MIGWLDQYQGLAAWVQAVGAIVALIVAIAIPYVIAAATRRKSYGTAAEILSTAVGYARMVTEHAKTWEVRISRRTVGELLRANEQCIWVLASKDFDNFEVTGKCLGLFVVYRTFVTEFCDELDANEMSDAKLENLEYYMAGMEELFAEFLRMTKQKDTSKGRRTPKLVSEKSS